MVIFENDIKTSSGTLLNVISKQRLVIRIIEQINFLCALFVLLSEGDYVGFVLIATNECVMVLHWHEVWI